MTIYGQKPFCLSSAAEVNSTWLTTSELANQRARKVLFTCVVYTKMQYDTAQPTQLNTKQYNTVDYTICFLWNLSWPGVKTVLKIERYAQRLTQGYIGDGGSS